MKKIAYMLALGAVLLSACQKNFLDRYPLDEISDENYWENEDQLKLAANGCYAYLKGKNTVDMENLADNTWWPSVTQYQTIGTGNYADDLGNVNVEWTTAYDGIRRCNHFLENYDKATNIQPAVKERLAGEVKFIRAYLYSYLVSFFGDVQLITKTLVPSDPELFGTRQPKEQVVDFILAELQSAADVLPLTYPAQDYGRITKGAALALKSRVALQHHRYDVAEKAAKDVIDLNIYSLYVSKTDPANSYWELFTYKAQASKNSDNKETILARVHTPEVSMHNLSREIQVPDQAVRWNPTKSLVDDYLCSDGLPIQLSPLYSEQTYNDIFKNRDPRFAQTILVPGSPWGGLDDGDAGSAPNEIYNLPKFRSDKKGAVTVTGFYFTKYCEPSAVPTYNKDENDIILLRYAEVLLNYAEALLEQGKLSQVEIDQTINALRNRVGMVPMKLEDLAAWGLDLKEEVRRERRIELALEGHRYFDLMRWKRGDLLEKDVLGMKRSLAPVPSDVAAMPINAEGYLLLSTNRTFVNPKHYLWPVPLVQRQRNENLGQNPGW